MKLNKIKSIRAKNFLSIGEKELFIDFTKLNNIICIEGNNLDIGKGHSNAAGKSICSEVLTYALYGKLIRGLTHKEAINKKIKRNLEVEVIFDDYRILRTRKPDGLKLFRDDQEVSLGGMPETQKEIERILGLSYDAFINIIYFGQHNSCPFLESDAATKRLIVENLLCLEKYRVYLDRAKKQKKVIEGNVKLKAVEYDLLGKELGKYQSKITQIETEIETWQRNKKVEINKLTSLLGNKEIELKATDSGKALADYNAAQEEIKNNINEIVNLENSLEQTTKNLKSKTDSLEFFLKSLSEQDLALHALVVDIQNVSRKILDKKERIKSFNLLNKHSLCEECYGEITEKNYENYRIKVEQKLPEIEKEKASMEEVLNKRRIEYDELIKYRNVQQVDINAIKTEYNETHKQLNNLIQRNGTLNKVLSPESNQQEVLINEQISQIKNTIVERFSELKGVNPYQNILESVRQELENTLEAYEKIKAEIQNLEAELPYYDFWIDGFGDNSGSIRSLIIDEIIPALNNRIDYWLQFLIDNKLKLQFNSQLEETIERNPPDGDPFVYNAMCGGERRRVNLAVSLAFAYVMMLSSNVEPSLIFLDEVAENIDKEGMIGIFNMIKELANERQVFITTHNSYLSEYLSDYPKIIVIKQDGFSYLKS